MKDKTNTMITFVFKYVIVFLFQIFCIRILFYQMGKVKVPVEDVSLILLRKFVLKNVIQRCINLIKVPLFSFYRQKRHDYIFGTFFGVTSTK